MAIKVVYDPKTNRSMNECISIQLNRNEHLACLVNDNSSNAKMETSLPP
jgi:hypothetical protein